MTLKNIQNKLLHWRIAKPDHLEVQTRSFLFSRLQQIEDNVMKFPYTTKDMNVGSSNTSWMKSLESELNKVNTSTPNWSIIIEVPSRLRRLREDAYTPVLVSIGPLHHPETSTLQAMKYHKIRYMQSLLNRTSDPRKTLSRCIEAILCLEDEAFSCYAYAAKVNSKAFAEIVLVDGCFIIELFIKYREKEKADPLFSNAWMMQALQRDLSLLENQIPYFVLHKLYDIIVVPITCSDTRLPDSLSKYALNFFWAAWRLNQAICDRYISLNSWECFHFLDLLHMCYQPTVTATNTSLHPRYNKFGGDECVMRSIGTLVSSGIKFRRGKSAHLLDIKFNADKGVLEIPHLCVDDMTETLLRNLVAFEQCVPVGQKQQRYVTSYVYLMDCLVDLSEDAQVLERGRVVTNCLGHYGHAADFFNNLCKEVVVTIEDKILFSAVCVQVSDFCGNFWPKNKAILRRDYFPNLWKAFAFSAALIILALAMLQAYYTVMPYYIPRN